MSQAPNSAGTEVIETTPLATVIEGAPGSALTARESREIVTPYAFHVEADLLGIPLASPSRRGVAMAIDGILILALAKASMLVLVPLMCYLMWLRLKLQKYTQVVLLMLVTFIAVASAGWAPELLFDAEAPGQNSTFELATAAQLTGAVVRVSKESCQEKCVNKELKSLRRLLQKNSVAKADAQEMLQGVLEASQIPAERHADVLASLLTNYVVNAEVDADVQAALKAVAPPEASAAVPTVERIEAPAAATSGAEAKPAAEDLPQAWYLPDAKTRSVLEWVNGVLQDLGIGFGWAVFYFTATVGWLKGQTIGKKLCQIRIVKLDGTPMDLWQAFSRQGGYGAGFATGLLGFLQIFWDPNRQAIQDKVSSTVVIRLNQPKRPLHH